MGKPIEGEWGNSMSITSKIGKEVQLFVGATSRTNP